MLIIICDAQDRIEGANREFLEQVGASESEVQGRPIDRFLIRDAAATGDLTATPRARLRSCKDEEIAVSLTVAELAAGSARKNVLIAERLSGSDGDQSATRSLSEREELEALRRLFKEKVDFARAVVSMLADPLIVIGEELRMTLDGIYGEVNDALRPHLTRAWEAVDQISECVRDVAEPSRSAPGKIEAKPARVNLAEMIGRTAHAYRSYIKDHGLNLALDLPAQPLFVWCDPIHYTRGLRSPRSRLRLRLVPASVGNRSRR